MGNGRRSSEEKKEFLTVKRGTSALDGGEFSVNLLFSRGSDNLLRTSLPFCQNARESEDILGPLLVDGVGEAAPCCGILYAHVVTARIAREAGRREALSYEVVVSVLWGCIRHHPLVQNAELPTQVDLVDFV